MKIISTNRVYCRLLADGTVIGPTHTRAYLHHLVKVHKQYVSLRDLAYVGGGKHG